MKTGWSFNLREKQFQFSSYKVKNNLLFIKYIAKGINDIIVNHKMKQVNYTKTFKIMNKTYI